MTPPIRLLRPVGAGHELVSARVFEDSFARALQPELDVRRIAAVDWLADVFDAVEAGDERAAAAAFAAAARGADFFCPDYRVAPLAPYLLRLRNRGRASVRLLLIAHAPGASPLDWALLGPLLRPGDRVIAPSSSALELLKRLYPELDPHVRVVPHPVQALPAAPTRSGAALVSLTRIHPSKLLHRQVESIAILRRRGLQPQLRIAGPLDASPRACDYGRSLAAKIRRLGLGTSVELAGEVATAREKASLLASAGLLLNLSVAVEESFGKAVAEALTCGVPALVTRWDGLPETAGSAGSSVAVADTGLAMDVDAGAVADAIERLLDERPPLELCRAEAERFRPERVRAAYRAELETAREETAAAAPAVAGGSGLLAATAPLTALAWDELFRIYAADARTYRARLAGVTAPATEADELRALVLAAVRRPVERLLAGLPADDAPATRVEAALGLDAAVAAAAAAPAVASSRAACLGFLAARGETAALEHGLAALRRLDQPVPGLPYLEVAALRLRGKHESALRLALAAADGEADAAQLTQLAAVAREAGRPELALPQLRARLERDPDGPDAARLWLERAQNAVAATPPLGDEARAALTAARRLTAPRDATEPVEVHAANTHA